jgi:hypothetical protein
MTDTRSLAKGLLTAAWDTVTLARNMLIRATRYESIREVDDAMEDLRRALRKIQKALDG